MRILDPNRASYKRTFSDVSSCVFCDSDEALECQALEGDAWRVIVNRYPYMDGNVMIVPKRHVETTEELSREEWTEFGEVLSRTQRALTNAFGMTSFNIGMNLGPESGASIAHIHWQVVPRKTKNITVLNLFADLYIVAITPEETKRRLNMTVIP